MRRISILSVAVGMLLLVAAPASPAAAQANSDPTTAARAAATWLANQVNDQGFIPSATDPTAANLSGSAQAVTAMAAAGIGREKVDAVLAYLSGRIDDLVVVGGADDASALSALILAVEAGGQDPSAFGPSHVDLIARLQAIQQPNGLYGTQDPSFDGAFRQGLALLALRGDGLSDPAGSQWLADQQCADFLWTAYRADLSVPCPPVDASSFTGPDTNSTALAMLGLQAQGHTAEALNGAKAVESVRNAAGGWGFLAQSDQPTDANSTGVVVSALRAVQGDQDARGAAELMALQVGCSGDPADQGGIAFQPGAGGVLAPDVLATEQATLGLSGVVLPQVAPTIASGLADVCATPVTAPTSAPAASAPTTAAPTSGTQPAGAQLPRTG